MLLVCSILVSSLHAQDAASKRRIISRPPLEYPPLARHLGLQGVVKLDALVSPDGTVKMVDIKGGHPVLAQAAAEGIRQWKWEAAPHESHEQVEVHFSPSQ
jgi:TonB family protein